MSKCINVSSAEFKSLAEMSGISSIELAAKMNLWMEDNKTDVWPSLEELGMKGTNIKEGVSELFESKESITLTENIADSYMADFNPNGDFEVTEYVELGFDLDDIQSSEFDWVDDVLSESELEDGVSMSFANLTKTLTYQRVDVNNELQNLYGKLAKANGKERGVVKSKIEENRQKIKELDEKIKESKKISNLEQLVEFGEDAIVEVQKILSKGDITDKQLNYIDRIAKF